MHVKLAALRGPLVLVALCAIPLVLWALAAPVGPRFSSSTLALTSAGVLCAFAGTSAFALNLVLGGRIRLVESLFGGLDRMYRVHRQNGQIAFVLLAAHAFLIFAGRVTLSVSSGFDLVTPRAGRTIFAGFVAVTLMGIALMLTLFVPLGQEIFVYVQRSFGFVFVLATYHVFTTQGAKSQSAALNWYMAALATAGLAAFAYRSLFHNVLVRRRRYTVAGVNRLDDFVTEIVLEPRSKPLAFEPGQFVFVSFRSSALRAQQRAVDISLQRQVFSIRAGEIGNQFHPFSITSARNEETLRITVKAIGDYTGALRRLDVGAEAIVEGPYGAFSNAGLHQAWQIWAAGGIGVTPFLSMARSLAGAAGPPVHFYFCVERPGEAHFLDEFRELEARRDDFVVTVVSRDTDGFLTAERLAAENPELESSDVLICGPPAMITSLRVQLVARGFPERQVHAEEFGFAKRGPEAAPLPVAPPAVREATSRRLLACRRSSSGWASRSSRSQAACSSGRAGRRAAPRRRPRPPWIPRRPPSPPARLCTYPRLRRLPCPLRRRLHRQDRPEPRRGEARRRAGGRARHEGKGRDALLPHAAQEEADRRGGGVRRDLGGLRLLLLELPLGVEAAEMSLRLELGGAVVDALALEAALLGAHVLPLLGTLGGFLLTSAGDACPEALEHAARTVSRQPLARLESPGKPL